MSGRDKFNRLVIAVPKPPAIGDTRDANRRFEKGHVFTFEGEKETYELTEAITMDVVEKLISDGVWFAVKFHLHTIKTVEPEPVPEPVLTRWQRFKLWLRGPVLPKARLLP